MKLIAAGNIDSKIAENLEKHGFEVLFTKPLSNLMKGLEYHPDMQAVRLGASVVCEPSVFEDYRGFIEAAKLVPVRGDTALECNYPSDVAYNIAVVSDFIFHNTKYTDGKIAGASGGKRFIHVPQGYCGCSICQTGGTSLITADVPVYKNAKKHGLDCLLISPGGIRLDGFDYGFIGGASFFYEDTVYFFGKISLHPDYDSIKSFCFKHGARICELSDGILSDYGSAVTLD